jgi:hypothetical protein
MLRALAGVSLLVSLAAPFLFFWGYVSEDAFRATLAGGSFTWFVFAGLAIRRRTPA